MVRLDMMNLVYGQRDDAHSKVGPAVLAICGGKTYEK
jgi:hypothetical protein